MNDSRDLLERLAVIDPADEPESDETREAVRRAAVSRLAGRERRPVIRAPRRRLALTSAAVAATGTVGVVMLAGPGGGGSVDVLAQARAALPSDDELVYARMAITSPEDGTHTYEQWATEDRWRIADDSRRIPSLWFEGVPFPGVDFPGVVNPADLEEVGLTEEYSGPVQEAYANGVSTFYADGLDAAVVSEVHEDSREIVSSNLVGFVLGSPTLLGGNPIEKIAEELDRGALRDAGLTEIEGREVRKFAYADGTVQYYVDPETFVPVRADILSNRVEFEAFETMPLDEETDDLLELPITEETKVVEAVPAEPDATASAFRD